MAEVFIRFPKTGLGNMMLVWARGLVFAKRNHLPYSCSTWWGFHWGALLRRENKSRMYAGYFNETPVLKRLKMEWLAKFRTTQQDPPLERIPVAQLSSPSVYLFTKPLTGEDIFDGLRQESEYIRQSLMQMLTNRMKHQLINYPSPAIGLHIRRGDFKLGNQTTPINHFTGAIQAIRAAIGQEIPATVFSDADALELADLLDLPGVSLAINKPDILDIILLSQSKWLILSKSSTFSYWAAFLSQATVIRPGDDWQPMIKVNSGTYREILWNSDAAGATGALTKQLTEPFVIEQKP